MSANTFDPTFLSRLQFAWVIAWHILLPAFTVGLSSFIAVQEGLWLATGRDVYVRISTFWIKIFAIAFVMGVVTGIVMPFQFGTNWSRYSDATANVLSPLFAYEDLTAFFLEAGFLGVLLFGRERVPPRAYFVSAVMVALGTLFSSFWILAANSWMQTPAGYEIVNGQFFSKDWLAVIFNPSFPYRLAHVVVGFFVTTGFVVLGVGAYLVRREPSAHEGRTMLSMALWLLTVLVPLQMAIGDLHGLNTRKYQPAKLAAIEARWDTGRRVPLTLFAVPSEKSERNNLAIEVPWVGQPDPDSPPRRRGERSQGLPGRQTPAGRNSVLRLQDHGGMRRHDARNRAAGRMVTLARAALQYALVSLARAARRADRLRGGDRRVVRHRGWAPTVDRLRAVADGAIGVAVAHQLRCCDLAYRLHARLSADLPVGCLPDASHRPQRAGAFR